MLRLRPSVTDSRPMPRRLFMRTTGFLVLAAGSVAMVGCGDDVDDLAPDVEDLIDADPGANDDGQTDDPGQVDDGNRQPVDEKPDGVEIQMSRDLLDVGGVQIVDDRATLRALDSDNGHGGEDSLILVRVDDATVAANTVTCTHQQCDVAYDEGRRILACPCHGSQFKLDGTVNQGPAARPLLTFEATIHEDSVFLLRA